MRKFAASLLFVALPALADNTIQIGVDTWKVPDQTARYLPNYAINNFHTSNAWVKANGSKDLGGVRLSYAAQASQNDNGRVDRLDADIALPYDSGVRVGVLPYRTSWCRTYDASSPWMAEPDTFCRFAGLNELSRGAFGVQGYHSEYVGAWAFDGMVGVYRPNVDGQNKALGPFVSVGPTTQHTAKGLAFNALNLKTGFNARLGYLHTLQNQDDTTGAKKTYERRLDYTTTYMAAEQRITERLDIRASRAIYAGNQLNTANAYAWHGQSDTIETVFYADDKNSFALGVTKYTNKTKYATDTETKQVLIVKSQTASYRHDFDDGWRMIVQYINTTDDYTLRSLTNTYRAGESFGIQFAKVFN